MNFNTPFKIDWKTLQTIRFSDLTSESQTCEIEVGEISIQTCLSKILINDLSKVEYSFKYAEGVLTERIVIPTSNKNLNTPMEVALHSDISNKEFEHFKEQTFHNLGIVISGEVPRSNEDYKMSVREIIKHRLKEENLTVDNVLISNENRESLILLTNEVTGEYFIGVEWGISKTENEINRIRFKKEVKDHLIDQVRKLLITEEIKILKGA
ncbi:hypothetical protein [Guptibacillus spartinae]|uniref:hypothetical protein n=1 Tax=Guptibacillus spartinae TaxID=3025679 RepID=UPI002362BDAA|nr:hypothetical protein [Pseudalkalibacillus spartinae]